MPVPYADLLAGVQRELAEANRLQAEKHERARNTREPSSFAGPGATVEAIEELAARGASRSAGGRVAENRSLGRRTSSGLAGAMSKAMAEGTGSAGGFLVASEVSADVMRGLRARSAIYRLGPTVVPVKKELAVTSISTGASAAYTLENANIAPSEMTLAQAPLLVPRELAALVPVSNRLLRDAIEEPRLDQVLRDDLSEIMALRADLAFIQGTGTGAEPLGVRNTAGLTPAPNLGPNGRAPTFDDLKDMLAALRSANAPFAKPGWVFNPRTINTLEKLKDSTGRYLADAGLLTFDATGGGGTLLGLPFVASTQVPVNITRGTSTDASFIVLGTDWQEAWLGENLGLTIQTSSEASYTPDGGATWVSSFQARQTLFRALVNHDFALRRPNLFSVLEGVRP